MSVIPTASLLLSAGQCQHPRYPVLGCTNEALLDTGIMRSGSFHSLKEETTVTAALFHHAASRGSALVPVT